MSQARYWLAALALLYVSAAQANFAFAISPPRFELVAKPGERLRQTVEITNAATTPASLLIRTADWDLQPNGGVNFHETLQPDSCRPWVAIERRELRVPPGQPYRFRFEVMPPAGQTPVECRFAIMLEGKEASTGAIVPVGGRVGVIVYVAVGNVRPELAVVGSRVETRNGQRVAVIDVRNSGTAHGRLDGFLSALDARGQELDVVPGNNPILPGETRGVVLNLARKGDPDTAVRADFPLTVKGRLEWGKGGRTELNQRFEQ